MGTDNFFPCFHQIQKIKDGFGGRPFPTFSVRGSVLENIRNFFEHTSIMTSGGGFALPGAPLLSELKYGRLCGVRMLLLMVLLGGCAGYRVVTQSNPLKKFGIDSVSIPAFVNQSGIPHISVSLTREMILMLAEYPHLRVYSGKRQKVDAILIGVIRSNDHRRNTVKTFRRNYVGTELLDSIGERNTFSIPSESIYRLTLQLALIKNPTLEEIELLQSNIGPQINDKQKILFNKSIPLEGRFQREVGDTMTSDSLGMVNFTKTKHHFEASFVELGKKVTSAFRDTILNAF